MASSRKLPTSYNTSTYGNATRDYTALATWESATDNDLPAAGDGEVLSCYNDTHPFNDYMSGRMDAITNSSYFRVIKPAAGEGHDGTPGTGVRFESDQFGDYGMFSINESYSQVQDLEIKNTYNDASDRGCGVILWSTPSNPAAIGCIFDTCLQNGIRQTSVSGIVANCLFIDCGSSGIWGDAGTVYVYNCTAVDCVVGFENDGGATCIAKNCVAEGNTTNWSGVWTKTTCTDDGGVTFVDSLNDDYHLASDDTIAKDQGTDLSADANYAFDDDVDGDTRPISWDIGFDEYTEGGWSNTILGIASPGKILGVVSSNIAKVNGVS